MKNHAGSWEFRTGPNSAFRLAPLPGMVALYGEGHFQFFANPNDQGIRELFPDEAAIVAAAQLHREGVTNKERFIAAVLRLKAERAITEYSEKHLRTFIHGCDCAPSVVRAKLRNMGYAGIIDRLDFEDRHPQLELSIFAIQAFMKQCAGAKTDEPEPVPS